MKRLAENLLPFLLLAAVVVVAAWDLRPDAPLQPENAVADSAAVSEQPSAVADVPADTLEVLAGGDFDFDDIDVADSLEVEPVDATDDEAVAAEAGPTGNQPAVHVPADSVPADTIAVP